MRNTCWRQSLYQYGCMSWSKKVALENYVQMHTYLTQWNNIETLWFYHLFHFISKLQSSKLTWPRSLLQVGRTLLLLHTGRVLLLLLLTYMPLKPPCIWLQKLSVICYGFDSIKWILVVLLLVNKLTLFLFLKGVYTIRKKIKGVYTIYKVSSLSVCLY